MKDLKDLLAQLHTSVAEAHIATVLSGEASDKDLEAARKFLSDNHITAAPEASKPLRVLTDSMPYADEELTG